MDRQVRTSAKSGPKEKPVLTIREAMMLSVNAVREHLYKSGCQLRGNAEFQVVVDQNDQVHGYIMKMPNGPLCILLDRKMVKDLL